MPLREYECPNCGRSERLEQLGDPPLSECPTCKAVPRLVFSVVNIAFKGSGWYVNDYGKKS